MKKLFERCSRLPNAVWIAVAVIALIAETLRRIFFGNGCLFKQLFGVSCPACGMTRAYISLLRLDIASAFHYNPAFLTFPVAVALGALAALDKKRSRLWLILFILDICVLLAVWVIRLATGTAV